MNALNTNCCLLHVKFSQALSLLTSTSWSLFIPWYWRWLEKSSHSALAPLLLLLYLKLKTASHLVRCFFLSLQQTFRRLSSRLIFHVSHLHSRVFSRCHSVSFSPVLFSVISSLFHSTLNTYLLHKSLPPWTVFVYTFGVATRQSPCCPRDCHRSAQRW